MAAGYTDNEIAAEIRAGRWSRLRRGSFVTTSAEPLSPEDRHVLRAREAMRRLHPMTVVSDQSAVLLHRLPLWGASLAEVHVTRPDRQNSRRRAEVRSHCRRLAAQDVTVVAETRVTTVERTLLDLACLAGFESAVCSMDAALRLGVVSRESLDAALMRLSRGVGRGHARRAAAFADGASESVGESRLRVAMHELGFPAPLLQHTFRDRSGRIVGRVDFWCPAWRTIVEFDGLVKYRGTMGHPVEVLVAEKRREDALRALTGARVVRVVWSDLADRRALERALRGDPLSSAIPAR